ncbi:MAG: PilZ domain-containing protein [Pseudomonadota bacterium]
MKDRKSKRLATKATGSYRTARGIECEVEFEDISFGGCRVDDMPGRLRLGEYVELTIGDAGPFRAEVAWRQSTRVGLEFTRALPTHILAGLCEGELEELKAPLTERQNERQLGSQADQQPAHHVPSQTPMRRFV